MGLAGVVGAGNNSNEYSGPDREKDLPDWLLCRAWTIHVVLLLASIVAGALPRNRRLARGLLFPGTLHGCVDLDLLPVVSWQLIGRLSTFEPEEDF